MMFSGIVEELGQINHIAHASPNSVELIIGANVILDDIKLGDSISVNGICLTVIAYTDNNFTVDVMPETIKATSLAQLNVDSQVNLERSLTLTDRIGGHFVTGHVDGVGTIIEKAGLENAVYYTITIDEELIKYIVTKGSVAIDGISLTVFHIDHDKNTITISLIPHTFKVTVLGKKQVNDLVNIEVDMLAKHVHNYLSTNNLQEM